MDHLTVRLPEYETVSLPASQLPETIIQQLHQRYAQQVHLVAPSVLNQYQWQLQAQGWVGIIPLESQVTLYLQPKVPIQNLLRIFFYVHGLELTLLEGLTDCHSLSQFIDRLVLLFARRLLLRKQQGFHRDYVAQQQQDLFVRGRLDIPLLVAKSWAPHLPSQFARQTADIEDNQILRWTSWLLLQSGLCSAASQQQLWQAYHSLVGVQLRPFTAADCRQRLYQPQQADYRLLHHLCAFFLSYSLPNHQRGRQRSFPFLIHMATLYEKFVAAWLKAHLPYGWQLKTQERVTLGQRTPMHFDIDMVLYDQQGQARIVLDTKYKAPAQVKRADFNQIVTYAQTVGCLEAGLIYPVSLPLDIQLGQLHVQSFQFALDGPLEAMGTAFLQQLRATLPFSDSTH